MFIVIILYIIFNHIKIFTFETNINFFTIKYVNAH